MAHTKNLGEPFIAHLENLYNIPCYCMYYCFFSYIFQYNALESCLAETVQISETLQKDNKDLKLQLMRMEARAMQL